MNQKLSSYQNWWHIKILSLDNLHQILMKKKRHHV